MPKLSQIRTSALRDLAEQLRFAPKAALRRQIDRARALAREIDEDATYEESWVVQRITGYAPTIDEPAILLGTALLTDLSALVERLCAAAKLRTSDLDEEVDSIETLAQRWGVSRRTVERYRRRGLVALRLHDTRSGASLVIARSDSDAFAQHHAERIERAREFTRMSETERERLVREAEDLQVAGGSSQSAAAARVAHRNGRSREAVRQSMRRDGSAELATRRRLSEADRRVIWRAWRMGVDSGDLASRFGAPRSSIHRIVCAQRASMLRDLGLPESVGIVRQPRGERGSDPLAHAALHQGLHRAVILEANAWTDAARSDGPIPADLERALVEGHLALMTRAAASIDRLDRRNPGAGSLDAVETDLRWAALVRIRLVELMRGAVARAIEERTGSALGALAPDRAQAIHASCMDAVISVVDRLDAPHTGRLAAPVALALNRSLARLQDGETGATASPRARARAIALADWTDRVAAWKPWLDLEPSAARRGDSLEEPLGELLALRFGLAGRRPHRRDQAASVLGLAPARTARLERKALALAHSR